MTLGRVTMSKEKSLEEYNRLIANTIYPEIKLIFNNKYRPLSEIANNCLVVLDTNTLLLPYKTGKQSLEEIRATYKKLVDEKRLIIPGQVAREFAKNRPTKLGEIYQKLLDKKSKLSSIQDGKYPLFEGLKEYQELINLEREVDKLINQYKEKLDNIVEYIRSLNWNDPISLVYKELFIDECLIEVETSKEDILKEFDMRSFHDIPPGYKDSSKEDGGIGDFLIWKTILQAGKKLGKDVIFVSSDVKADWWYSHWKQNLYPRYELIYEFLNYSGGKSIHIIQLSSLLDLYKASKDVVKEIENEEVKVVTEEYIDDTEIIGPKNYILDNYIKIIEKYGIGIEDIEDIILDFKQQDIKKVSTIDIVKKLTKGYYKVGHPINKSIGRILSELKDTLNIVAFGRRTEIDDNGRVTTTQVWKIQ